MAHYGRGLPTEVGVNEVAEHWDDLNLASLLIDDDEEARMNAAADGSPLPPGHMKVLLNTNDSPRMSHNLLTLLFVPFTIH